MRFSMTTRTQLKTVLAIFLTAACYSASGEDIDQCTLLNNTFKPALSKLNKFDKIRKITIKSTDRPPSRATAALLAAALRYRLGYYDGDDVVTSVVNSTLCNLVTELELADTNDENYRFMIHVDADWENSELCPALREISRRQGENYNIAGLQLQVLGAAVSVNLKLYARLSRAVANDTKCLESNTWPFYNDPESVHRCHFFPEKDKTCIPVVYVSDSSIVPKFSIEDYLKEGRHCANATIKTRAELMTEFKKPDASILFVDYDVWDKHEPQIREVQPRTQVSVPAASYSLRVAESNTFRQFAPQIMTVVTTLIPQSEDIKQILEINTNTNNMDKAACSWANTNIDKFTKWTDVKAIRYWISVLLCKDQENEYKKVINHVFSEVDVDFQSINCSVPTDVSNYMMEVSRQRKWHWWAGAVAAGAGGAAGVDVAITKVNTPLVLYDIPSTKKKLNVYGLTSTGRLQPLAAVIKSVFDQHHWRRVAVISETSVIAEELNYELFHDGKIKIRNEELASWNSDLTSSITNILQNFHNANARIFFINASPYIANLVVCEALRLGLTGPAEYAWVVREWHPTKNCDKLEEVQVLTASYWWRGGKDSLIEKEGGNGELRSKIARALGNSNPWPPLTAPLVDAVQLLLHRLRTIQREYPELRTNIHAYLQSAAKKILETPIPGVTQSLRMFNFSVASPIVYVTAWKGNNSRILSLWRADDSYTKISEAKRVEEAYIGMDPPNDGTSRCIIQTTADPFEPPCHDAVCFVGAAMLVVAAICIFIARRIRLKRMKQRDNEMLIRLLARCKRTAAALASHLVDRSALTLHEELGSGHFGSVRLGILRLPNCAPMSVAAKALRKDAAPAEEAEFLREGCALASLDHQNVVKLVGVCASDGPPLLLMENAFFGDLQRYLRTRRHLAEMHEQDPYMHDSWVNPGDSEVRHVSPPELTRFSREAASALAYLANHHYVHRDIRAANCLVDTRRTLKLADFGMARKVGKATAPSPQAEQVDTDYKYICQRRGVFPVPWMAPESLERGEFSYASDVWGLGVLILEIASLGSRPFGAWRPPRILLYVRSGGRPPLPRDASYHTCEVTDLCWHISPSRRATASEIEAYLALHPQAVRAALRCAWPEEESPDATDSGFGERNGDNINGDNFNGDGDWPLSADMRVSTL